MDWPASYYGPLDKRNPVISAFERDVNSFTAVMKRATSSSTLDNSLCAKGIKTLAEIWRKYKHRIPINLYQEYVLKIADFLFGIKLYDMALWQGYGLHLQQYTPVNITEVKDVDHLMACFFPEGLDKDQDTVGMKVRALQGCILCIFEQEKRHSVLRQKGLSKLLCVLNLIRIMMQAFQQHEHLCWHMYNGSLLIYNICRYLMTMDHSSQALEYLLWASISLEFCIPLLTTKYVPWIVTLYCAVCQCYYDNHATVQAEKFARRALGKITELAKLEEQSGDPTTRENQIAYKEASIKVAAMIFKRAVFEGRKKPKAMAKMKSSLKDMPNAPWPSTATERILTSLFDSSAAQFLGILEALWDSTRRPLQTVVPDEPEQLEVVLELISAGISILSGFGEQKKDQLPCEPLSAISETPSSSLIHLAIMGENKVSYMSAVRFIKLLFHCKQPDVFNALSQQMLRALAAAEGQSIRKAELELVLLHRFSSLSPSQKEKQKTLFSISDDLFGLTDTLHKSVCATAPELQPSKDLVLDIVLFLWDKLNLLMDKAQQQYPESRNFTEKIDNNQKWIECLSMLCEVAFAIDLAVIDCIMTAEMTQRLAILLESCATQTKQEHSLGCSEAYREGVKPQSFSAPEGSSIQLLQRLCEVVEGGRRALSKGILILDPQDGSAVTDCAFMQKFSPSPLSSSLSSPTPTEEEKGRNERNSKEKEQQPAAKLDVKHSRHTQETCVFLLALDLHLELDIIHHRASLKLLQLNAVSESELFDRIKKNKVSKALFLMQKALLLNNNMEPHTASKIQNLIEEACTLIEKAQLEEKKLYMSAISTNRNTTENHDRGLKRHKEKPPPPPLLLSRTEYSLTFVPAPDYMAGRVYWYQLCGRAAQGHNQKVRLGDCSLPGTGNLVPAVSDGCVLQVEGLEPNEKYVFAVAAYDSQGNLLGNSIGETTLPLLASLSLPLLTTWAHLAQVAFQTEQYVIAKRACQELWSNYTYSQPSSATTKDAAAMTKLHVHTLQLSSPLLRQLFFTSIFIETEIDIQQGSFYCDSFSDNGPFIWEQESRLAHCERMLVAVDLASWLTDNSAALQAAVNCYGFLAPLIFHQVVCDPVVEVLTKCLIVLEKKNSALKQKWIGNTSESLMHMIACITYYLSKALRVFKEHEKAAAVMDRGQKLLQEVYDAQVQISKLNNEAEGSKKGDASAKMSLQLKALHGKNKTRIVSEAALTNDSSHPVTDYDGLAAIYDLISTSPLKDAYQDVMKLRCKAYFTEFATLLLQRALEEEQPDFVIKWGQNIFNLPRRDEHMGVPTKRLDGSNWSKGRGSTLTQKGSEPPQSKSTSADLKKKTKPTVRPTVFQRARPNRDIIAVENLFSLMSSMVQRCKKQKQLRKLCSEERMWKSHLNYTVGMAHLAVLYRRLDQLHGGPLLERYSQLDPLCFSMAYSGVLVRQINPQWQHLSKPEVASERNSTPSVVRDNVVATTKDRSMEEVKVDDSGSEDSDEDDEDTTQQAGQQLEMQKLSASLLLDSLNKAALHLRRAMVLAHRGSHWTSLQHICQTTWDQNCRMTLLVQRTEQAESSSITPEQLKNIFTPLLMLSADLIMDMLNRLGLWRLYDNDLTEETESSLHFSALWDDTTKVDLRWVRTLVLHTLEQLHHSQKWENLAHFSLLFNTYTQERYASTVTPLLVNAQRKLLERIRCFGGPNVPQPHHVKTQKITGKKVTCRSYAGCRILSGWISKAPPKSTVRKRSPHNRPPKDPDELQGAEVRRSMSLVCVPLDVEDTLRCYREALEKRPPCLSVFQHSQTLLLLLIAHTQPYYVAQEPPSRGPSHSASLVDFSPVIMSAPSIQPRNLTEEDYSKSDALYSLPISRDHMHIVMGACSSSIKHLRGSSHDSLKVLALHEMGNLQFFNGNTRAAHSHWSKAVDCALKSSGVLEKWDGVSFGGGSLQQILKLAGIWGCLQAACLTAKISQYIFTLNISQRTHCCLLSAHLFKCVLCCSLAQPQSDLQYASHVIADELLPGVDLFSEGHRIHLGTTVTSLNFICHWLFTTGYHITLLPMLALYLHFVGTVCRDVQLTVEGKILKIRALTELGLFTEAVKEVIQLTTGTGVRLPLGHYIHEHKYQLVRTFYSNKSLLDNIEVLEELMNCDFTPEVRTLYGSTLCLRFYLARIQLVLAISSTIYGPPQPESPEGERCYSTGHRVNSEPTEQDRLDTEASCPKTEERTVLAITSEKETITLERIKFLLLEAASSSLSSVTNHLTSPSCCHVDLELALESYLLKANLYLQQGQAALSSKMAASSLALLQSSPVIVSESKTGSEKSEFQLPYETDRFEQDTDHCRLINAVHGDCLGAVEARQRIGCSLWLRCRLALVRGVTAHLPVTGVCFPGRNINEEAARIIKEGVDECEQWGDLDTQALLMVEGAELHSKRGRTEDSLTLVKEAVRLVSGRPCMPPWSCITVARAALLLSELRGTESTTLLKLTQTLLQNQLSIFGQSANVAAGGLNVPRPETNNICAPYLHMLNLAALRIGQILDHSDATEKPLSAKSSESDVKHN